MNCFEKLVFGLFEFVYIISALIIFSLGASLLGVSLYYSLDNTYYNVGEIISDAFQAYVDTSNNSYNYYQGC